MFDHLSRSLIAGLRLGAFKSPSTLQARGAVITDATEGLAGPTAVPKGRYRIVSDLGAGAFGNVSLAEDEATGHEVAIRFLPRGLAGVSQTVHTRPRMGGSIVAAAAAHPALVRVLEFGDAENGHAFVAMEHVQGRRLTEILSEGPLEVDAGLRWAIELGGAVETLHNMGLVHGALRPHNVTIRADGGVKLMDVELAGLRDAWAMRGISADEAPAAAYRSRLPGVRGVARALQTAGAAAADAEHAQFPLGEGERPGDSVEAEGRDHGRRGPGGVDRRGRGLGPAHAGPVGTSSSLAPSAARGGRPGADTCAPEFKCFHHRGADGIPSRGGHTCGGAADGGATRTAVTAPAPDTTTQGRAPRAPADAAGPGRPPG